MDTARTLQYELSRATTGWVHFDYDLEAFVLCTQYVVSPHDARYRGYLLHTYSLDSDVVIYSEKRSKEKELCCSLFQESEQVFCRHLGMIQQREKEGFCFNQALCAEVLVKHIFVDALMATKAHDGDSNWLRLSVASFGELHSRVSRREKPGYRTYTLTMESAERLQLSQAGVEVCKEILLKLYRLHWMEPPCKLLIIDQDQLQGRKRDQLLELLPCGTLLALLENQQPKHLHVEPQVRVRETETGTEYAVSLLWRGIYMMEKPGLWIETQ